MVCFGLLVLQSSMPNLSVTKLTVMVVTMVCFGGDDSCCILNKLVSYSMLACCRPLDPMLLKYSAWSRRVLCLELLGTLGCLWARVLLRLTRINFCALCCALLHHAFHLGLIDCKAVLILADLAANVP